MRPAPASRRRPSLPALLVLVAGALALAACPAQPPPPQGMVLVVVDTLRADHLGLYGYERPTSPELDRWARRGRVFERALASSPWTLPSVASILTGRLPSDHGARSRRSRTGTLFHALGPTVPTLAERLSAGGRTTGAIAGSVFLRGEFGLARGFAHRDTGLGRPAAETVDLALDWLGERSGEPFFLFLHLLDPHRPYDAPPPFGGRFGGEAQPALPLITARRLRRELPALGERQRAALAGAYDEEVAYVDAELGRLFAALEERGLWESTLVVLTSDHGEELFDHGSYEHGHNLLQELLRVPLVVWGPGVEAGRDPLPVTVADLAPTFLEAAGLEPLAETDGLSLWPRLTRGAELPARALHAEATLDGREKKAVVDWPHKMIWEPESGAYLVFDLDRDPGERRDVAPRRPALVARLSGLLRDRVRRVGRGVEGVPVALDPELADGLRAQGYLE